MNVKIVVFIFVITSFFEFCFAQTDSVIKPFDSTFYNLNSEEPGENLVRIENLGKDDATFSFKLNNGFFRDFNDLKQSILQFKDEFPNEPLPLKTWRFVCNYVDYNMPLMNNHWQQNPLILLNSLGYDKCGNQAEMLAFLWREFGFETRIWSLKGHIVPEVFFEGSWQMYDPSNKVYYLNHKKNVASVEELAKFPSLITSPLQQCIFKNGSINNSLFESISYSRFLASIYASTDDNNVYSSSFLGDTTINKLELNLPVNGVFEFPLLIPDLPTPKLQFLANNSVNARLTIPKNWNGKIDLPFVICRIRGDGKIKLNDKLFDLDSKKINDYLRSFSELNYRLELDGNQSEVEIIYFINSAFASLKDTNELQLIGTNIQAIQVTLEPLDSDFFCSKSKNNLFYQDLKNLMKAFETNSDKISKLVKKNKISNWKEISRITFKISNLLCQFGDSSIISNQQLEEKIEILERSMKPKFVPVLFEFLGTPKNFVVFMALLNTFTAEEISQFAVQLLQKK